MVSELIANRQAHKHCMYSPAPHEAQHARLVDHRRIKRLSPCRGQIIVHTIVPYINSIDDATPISPFSWWLQYVRVKHETTGLTSGSWGSTNTSDEVVPNASVASPRSAPKVPSRTSLLRLPITGMPSTV